MSVVYNTRNPLPTGPYSSLNDDHNDDHNDGVVPRPNGFNPLNNGDPTLIPGSSSPTPSRSNSMSPEFLEDGPLPRPSKGATKNPNGRMKPIPKPLRQPVKGRNGKYACTWPDCRANVKEFSRKCEWSKHMDKHERPYKCKAVGCENIPGFTYSGGLLRHEREVHRKHGGPKNPLYCPHKNCKRHKDSSFARLENLNEHLRRCHTSNSNINGHSTENNDRVETVARSEEPVARSVEPELELGTPPTPFQDEVESQQVPYLQNGTKRKAEDHDSRLGNKRARYENHELKRKIEAGYLHACAMMEQINTLEAIKKEIEEENKRLGEKNTELVIHHNNAADLITGLRDKVATLENDNCVLINENTSLRNQLADLLDRTE